MPLELVLACKLCRWRPQGGATTGLVKAHYETEHPDHVDADGQPKAVLELVLPCPRCDTEMPLHVTIERPRHFEHYHTCPTCHRSAVVRRTKGGA